jgi:hypothetical protein
MLYYKKMSGKGSDDGKEISYKEVNKRLEDLRKKDRLPNAPPVPPSSTVELSPVSEQDAEAFDSIQIDGITPDPAAVEEAKKVIDGVLEEVGILNKEQEGGWIRRNKSTRKKYTRRKSSKRKKSTRRKSSKRKKSTRRKSSKRKKSTKRLSRRRR